MEGSVSNQRMQQMLDLHPTDIGKVLSGLVDKGMLVSEPKGRWTTYTINKEYQQVPEQLNLSDIENTEIIFGSETDRIIYQYIRANGLITTKQVVANTRISTQQGASAALNRLIGRGLIEKTGTGHNVYYVLPQNK